MDRNLYMKYVSEYFDITDKETRKCLITINEADQNQVLGNLASKLYNAIVNKITDIDFGAIPTSKGDITKIPNYMEMMECLNTVREMMVNQHQSTESTDTIFNAIENVKRHQKIWEKGYLYECEMVAIFYNTICLSIVSATSTLIAACVEFIKNPTSEIIDVEVNKVLNGQSKDRLLFKNLEQFNKSCKKGDIEKTFSKVLSAQKNVRESGNVVNESIAGILFVTGAVIGLLSCVIPILHQLTTMLYNLRQDLSDYFAGQADLLLLNAEKVNYNRSKTPEQKKKIIAKQHKIADRFRRWSNKLMIKTKSAEKATESQTKEERNTKNKISDVVDTMPDSADVF